MDCFVGAATGALKGITLRDNVFTNLNTVKTLLPKQDEITSMTWNGADQVEVLTAHMDRQLKVYDSQKEIFIDLFTAEGGEGAIKGMHATDDKIITCVESGDLNIWDRTGKRNAEYKVGPGINAMRGSDERNEVVTGGMKNLVKTWDIETGKQTWSAKNLPLDFLQIEVPIMCTDVRFVPGQHTIVEATKMHEMRLYDPRQQRRPVKLIPFMENPITSISPCYRENHMIAANSIGEIGLFDLRSKVHPVCKYKGQAGSIRSIDAHPTAPYVATCGIDRFLRVHNIDTKKLIHKVYCKTRLNKVLIRNNLSIMGVKKELKQEADEEDWAEMKDARSDGESDGDSDSDVQEIDGDVWDEMPVEEDEEESTVAQQKTNKKKRKEEISQETPELSKKKKLAPTRKRQESIEVEDEPEPTKKTKKMKSLKRKEEPEVTIVKEEVDSAEDEELPEPPKRKKMVKKGKGIK